MDELLLGEAVIFGDLLLLAHLFLNGVIRRISGLHGAAELGGEGHDVEERAVRERHDLALRREEWVYQIDRVAGRGHSRKAVTPCARELVLFYILIPPLIPTPPPPSRPRPRHLSLFIISCSLSLPPPLIT